MSLVVLLPGHVALDFHDVQIAAVGHDQASGFLAHGHEQLPTAPVGLHRIAPLV
jgi:hypothetical protein